MRRFFSDESFWNTPVGPNPDYHPSKSWNGLLRGDELYQMPLEHFRVLKLGPITHAGESHRSA